jgi:hypothetical protein
VRPAAVSTSTPLLVRQRFAGTPQKGQSHTRAEDHPVPPFARQGRGTLSSERGRNRAGATRPGQRLCVATRFFSILLNGGTNDGQIGPHKHDRGDT